MAKDDLRAVNKFTITRVRVERAAAGYQVNLEWKAATAYPPCENYWVWTFCGEELFLKQAVPSKDNVGHIQVDEADPSRQYLIALSDEETEFDPDKCEKIPLCFASYENLKGGYEDRALSLEFHGPGLPLDHGKAEVIPFQKTDWSPELTVLFGRGERALTIPVHAGNYEAEGAFKICLTPFVSGISSGPEAMSDWFLLRPADILSCGVKEEAGKVLIETSFTCAYDGEDWKEENILAQAVLYATDGAVWKSSWKELTREEDDTHQITWEVNAAPWCDITDQCAMLVQLSIGGCSGARKAVKEAIPLLVPEITKIEADALGLDVYWDYQLKTVSFSVSDGTDSWVTGKRHLRIAGNGLDMLDTDVNVSMVAGNAAGPASSSKTAFLPGYYMNSNGMMTYCSSSRGESEVLVPGLAGLFSAPLTEDIAQGPLSIDTGGTLRIQKQMLTTEDFDAFMELLGKSGLTVAGYYRMRSLLSRQTMAASDDILYYYAALSEKNRTSMLIPGMSLAVTPAGYMWQTSREADDNAGMVQGSAKRLPILFRENDKKSYLSVNAYLDRQIPGWKMEPETTEPRIIYGGEMDFLDQRLEKPYWTIWYPHNFKESSLEPSCFPSDNPVLLAADDRHDIETAVELLNKNSTKPITVSHLIVRGRSVLIPEITVWFNGNPISVPLGTRMKDFIEMQGSDCGDLSFHNGTTRIMRRTGRGCCPVHLKWFDQDIAESLPLLGGDCITTD